MVRLNLGNDIVADFFLIHQKRLKTLKGKTVERFGGYLGMPNYFSDVEYQNAVNDRLLSRIRWEQKTQRQIYTPIRL